MSTPRSVWAIVLFASLVLAGAKASPEESTGSTAVETVGSAEAQEPAKPAEEATEPAEAPAAVPAGTVNPQGGGGQAPLFERSSQDWEPLPKIAWVR